jgi:uncharacterized protein
MVCDWDDQKNIRNQRKHGIPFEIAVDALDDPYGLFLEDFLDDNGEMRYQSICMFEGILYLIAFTRREIEGLDMAWIVSIRKAVRYEQEKYFEH